METQLIEITNRMLFTEYLRHLGLRVPNLYQGGSAPTGNRYWPASRLVRISPVFLSMPPTCRALSAQHRREHEYS